MLAKVRSATVLGVEGHPVRVEVHVAQGLPGFTVVGLPDVSCRESRDRVRAAVQSSKFTWQQQRITVNLAPTSLRKVGSGLDLAMAVGLLVATQQLSTRVTEHMGFLAELGLDGSLRPVPGVLPALDALCGVRPVVALANLAEARLLRPDAVGAADLRQLVAALRGDEPWPEPASSSTPVRTPAHKDLSEVQGHVVARAALEVAAAGGHHLLMSGPPGAGKTMLAERLVGLLPDLDERRAMQVSRVHSVAAQLRADAGLPTRPPYRAPHHTASLVAMIGGGSSMLRPGEISLASGTVQLCSMSERAAIYCRISRDPSGGMLGVQRQEKACRELADANGWTPVDPIYVDDDRSAYSGKPRPGYDALLAAVKAHDVDVVVAWAPDRLTRSTRDLETLIDTVEAAKVDIATVQSGIYDLSTPSGRMSARVVGAVARYESEHKSARLRAKSAEIAATGRVGGGGSRPYGFEGDRRAHRRSEVKVIREAARRIVEGETIRGVVADLNARKVATVSGAPWKVTTLRRILIAPRTAGLRQHQGQTIGKAEWKPIIDETTHHQLRAILLDPERRTNQGARRYLLTGYVYCGLCGAKLVARPRSDKARCYVCSRGPNFTGCGKIRTLSETLEDHVVAMIVEAVDSDALAAAATPEPTGDDIETTAEIARIESDMDALAEDYSEGRVSRDMFTKTAARLDARKVDAQRALSTAATVDRRAGVLSDPVPLGERWPDMNFDQRRVVIDAVVERIVVGPAVKGRNYFDPDRVSIEWRV